MGRLVPFPRRPTFLFQLAMQTRQMCYNCGVVYDIGEFQFITADNKIHSVINCRKCERGKQAVADRRIIAKASRELVNALAQTKRANSADLPAIVDSFKRKIGGTDALADMLAKDMRRLHGCDLPPEAEKDFQWHEQVIQKYHQMLLKVLADNDAKSADYDLSALSEDDLKSILAPLAREMLLHDSEFRNDVLTLASDDASEQELVTVADAEGAVDDERGIDEQDDG